MISWNNRIQTRATAARLHFTYTGASLHWPPFLEKSSQRGPQGRAMLGGKPPNQKKAATIALTGLFQNWGSVSQDNNLLIKHMSGPCLLRSATLQWQLTVVMSHLPKTFLVKKAFWQASRRDRMNLMQLVQTSCYSPIIWTIYITGNVQICI